MNVGDKVKLLTHDKRRVYEVHGLQFIYSDFDFKKGENHVRILTEAHGQKWWALVPVSQVEENHQ